jgi:hypothetical protein
LIENYLAKRDSMAALSAARNILLLDYRLRGNDEANGYFDLKTGNQPYPNSIGLYPLLVRQ